MTISIVWLTPTFLLGMAAGVWLTKTLVQWADGVMEEVLNEEEKS